MNGRLVNRSSNLRIAYLVKTYPRLSETFVLNEILGLERLGVDLRIFSLKRPDNGAVHPDVAKVRASVEYVPSLGPDYHLRDIVALVLCHLLLAFVRPWRYVAAVRFHFFKTGKSRLKDFLQAGYLARALRKENFENLHVHFANVPATVAEVVQRFIGIRYTLTAHAKDIYLTPADELARKIRSAECVLTCTAYNQRYLAHLAAGDTPVRLAYHGIDVSRFVSRTGAAAKAGDGPPMILSVGRFCEKKGFKYLILACALLKERGHRFQCQIVGYGELQKELERMVSTVGLQGWVTFPGTMTQDQLAALYPQASMFVLPCQLTEDGDRDGIPNVLIEAMACGLPVVSTDISGISELVSNGEDGFLVGQKNAVALADAMELLLARPELCSRLSKNAANAVQQTFTLEASAQGVREILYAAFAPRAAAETSEAGKFDVPAVEGRR
jgi:glycosyltransferase involved in cell wall biosynthesis